MRKHRRLEDNVLNEKPYIRKRYILCKNYSCKIGGVHIRGSNIARISKAARSPTQAFGDDEPIISFLIELT